jgi:polar amino acid transport system substrate-binding protein
MKFFISILLYLCVTINPVAAQQTVSLATLEWPPYTGKNLVNNGFTAEIVGAAFQAVEVETKTTFLPWSRGLKEVSEGRIDAIYPAYYSRERLEAYTFSSPFISGPLVFIKRKETQVDFEELQDLKQYSIGVVHGYVNTPEFDEADFLNKKAVKSDEQNIVKLIKGRLDLAVVDKFTALNILATKYPESLGKLDFVTKPLEEKPLHVMCSKMSDRQQELCSMFNRGLILIKKNGKYQKIIERIQNETESIE